MVDQAATGLRADPEWERKEQLAAAMVEFLEGWVITELCLRFRTVADALYKETPEQRLLISLLDEERPLSFRQICSKSGLSRKQLLPDRRLRRAMERLEESGIVTRSEGNGEEMPKYAFNRGNVTSRLILRIFANRAGNGGLVASTLREGLGPAFGR